MGVVGALSLCELLLARATPGLNGRERNDFDPEFANDNPGDVDGIFDSTLLALLCLEVGPLLLDWVVGTP